MKKIILLFLLLSLMLCSSVQSQVGPYMEELYGYEVEENVIYGVNATILPIIAQQTNEALPQPLIADVYRPVGDNNTARPLMLVLHTGNFLPFPANNNTGGTIRDSTVVEVCKRLAKRGYVAASIDYRLGWNPIDPSQDFRKFFLINAAYRGVQDCRTAVRYFRKTIVDDGNPYGIDSDKIGTWGIGTGGYIVGAHATLDEYLEIATTPVFLIDLGDGMPAPMVLEAINGDLDGTIYGVVDAAYAAATPFIENDTLCYPNHVTYNDGTTIPSQTAFTVNNGGALGEISWIDNDMAPWVSFQSPTDNAAPYTSGILTVPGTGDPDDPTDDIPIVNVYGAYDIQQRMNELGYNDIFDAIPDDIIDYSEVADARNDGFDGLFPLPNNIDDVAPWSFYAEDNPNAADPPHDPVVAKTYFDTMMAYITPRACLALGLDCDFTSSTEEVLSDAEIGLKMAPNPTTNYTIISTANAFPIQSYRLYDISGRLVETKTDLNTNQIQINKLNTGVYFAKLGFEEGVITKKIVFQ